MLFPGKIGGKYQKYMYAWRKTGNKKSFKTHWIFRNRINKPLFELEAGDNDGLLRIMCVMRCISHAISRMHLYFPVGKICAQIRNRYNNREKSEHTVSLPLPVCRRDRRKSRRFFLSWKMLAAFLLRSGELFMAANYPKTIPSVVKTAGFWRMKWYPETKKNRFVMRFFLMVGMTGFEPATTSSLTKCATKLRYIPGSVQAPPAGIEPATNP